MGLEQAAGQQTETGWRGQSVRRTRRALGEGRSAADRLALLRTLAWLSGGRVDLAAEGLRLGVGDLDLIERFGLRVSEDCAVLRLAEERSPDWWPRPFRLDPGDRRGLQPGSADAVLRRLTRNRAYRSFAQKGAVRAMLTQPGGSGLMASMPTGAGKSLLFQLAALAGREARAGSCVAVVTPTVALALDHERSLAGMPGLEGSRALTGDQAPERARETVNAFRRGEVPVLLLGPEMALRDDIAGYLAEAARPESVYGLDARLTHLFIDEAHIVESWGRSFRPDFQRLPALLGRLRAADPEVRLVLLSATLGSGARAVLRRDWGQGGAWLEIDARVPRYEHDVAVGSFREEAARAEAVAWAVDHVPRPAILYTTEVDAADALYSSLRESGYQRIERFTGETAPDARRAIVRRWAEDQLDLVVATSAFGMGVDKADVRSVVHACLPEGPARWYQEIGRAARDGGQGVAALLFTDRGERDDVGRARGIATGGWLTRELAEPRWAAMLRGARQKGWAADGRWRMRIDLDAIREGLRPHSSDYNRMWNMALLTLMQRAGAVAILSVEPGEGEAGHVWDVEVRDVELLDGGAAAWDRVFAVREAELGAARSEFDPFLRIARRPERACLTRAAFELIEPASFAPPCGRCPHCRAERIAAPERLPCGGLDAAWTAGPVYAGPLPPGPLLVEPGGASLPRRIRALAGAGIEQFVVADDAAEPVLEALGQSAARLGLVITFAEWEGDAVLAPVAAALLLPHGERREAELIRRFAGWGRERPFPTVVVAEADRLVDGRRLDQFLSRHAPIPEQQLTAKEEQVP